MIRWGMMRRCEKYHNANNRRQLMQTTVTTGLTITKDALGQ
jgi:hypothetical protein